MKKGIKEIIIYEIKMFIDSVIVILEMISLNKKIIKPIDIDKNKTLKKFSFL